MINGSSRGTSSAGFVQQDGTYRLYLAGCLWLSCMYGD